MNPYYEEDGIAIYHGDARKLLPDMPPAHLVIADPPYGQTSLDWDRWPEGWVEAIQTSSMWVFGTMRMFLKHSAELMLSGFSLSQDIVWEKQNGSSFHADRFRRVHEQICHWYKGPWEEVYKNPVTTPDATARTFIRKRRPAHMGNIEASAYSSQDGGPRLMRSVIFEPNCHGNALNETQKPLAIVRPLIEYSCPEDGLVIDPFCGSGTTLIAAREMGRIAIGIEMREEQCERAAKRLSQGILKLS